jgi:hypothetical protein
MNFVYRFGAYCMAGVLVHCRLAFGRIYQLLDHKH